MKLTAEFLGVNKAVARFKLLEDSTRERIRKAMEQACILVEGRAKDILATIPWETGEHGLRRSTGVKFPPYSLVEGHNDTRTLSRSLQHKTGWISTNDIVGAIGSDVPYAPYVEALPDGGFLIPALRENQNEAFELFAKGVREAVKDTGGEVS